MASTAVVDIGSLVTQTPGVYGGRPCLAGTRFPILQVAACYQAGWTANDLAERYGLDLAKVHAGIAYYLANQQAVDQELQEREAGALRLKREAEDAAKSG